MIRHFFLDKTNSIVEGKRQNMGLNPVMHIGYGNGIMRGLLHFDVEPIKKLIEDKTFANTEKLRFTLKMTNCFSVDTVPYEKNLIRGLSNNARRACSFDLMLFRLPCPWDQGRGFEFVSDFWITDKVSDTEDGSSWYFAANGIPWETELDLVNLNDPNLNWAEIGTDNFGLEGGVYSFETLDKEYNKYLDGKPSLVIGSQHFDFGNENLSIDITDYVMDVIKTGYNYGLCLAFIPRLEASKTEVQQYVGFFDDNTNTFFHPYVEANYSEYIKDDRDSFTIGKDNNLYLYVSDDGEPTNLDDIPSCSFDGINANVEQVGKGVYCAHISPKNTSLEGESIYYDTWSNIALNGQELDDVEMEVVSHSLSHKIKVGENSNLKANVIASLSGINDDEKLNRGEVREVSVDFLQKYSSDKKIMINSAEWRLYVKDGNRELDVIPFQPIEKTFLNNFFILYTEDLIPNEYYVDIRAFVGREIKYFKSTLNFKVISNITKRYE